MDVGILLVNPEGVSPPTTDLYLASLKIVFEGEVVVEKLTNLPEAVGLLFGLTYGLHLTKDNQKYPPVHSTGLFFIWEALS